MAQAQASSDWSCIYGTWNAPAGNHGPIVIRDINMDIKPGDPVTISIGGGESGIAGVPIVPGVGDAGWASQWVGPEGGLEEGKLTWTGWSGIPEDGLLNPPTNVPFPVDVALSYTCNASKLTVTIPITTEREPEPLLDQRPERVRAL